MGAGINGLTYTLAHYEETDNDKFWRGWGSTVGVGLVTGAITGAISAGLSSAQGVARIVAAADRMVLKRFPSSLFMKVVAKTMAYGGRALMGALSSAAQKIASNLTERAIFGKDIGIFSGVGQAALFGALSGAASAIAGDLWKSGGNVKFYRALGMTKKAETAAAENAAKAAERAAARIVTPNDRLIEGIGQKYNSSASHWDDFFEATSSVGKINSPIAGGPGFFPSGSRTNPFG